MFAKCRTSFGDFKNETSLEMIVKGAWNHNPYGT